MMPQFLFAFPPGLHSIQTVGSNTRTLYPDFFLGYTCILNMYSIYIYFCRRGLYDGKIGEKKRGNSERFSYRAHIPRSERSNKIVEGPGGGAPRHMSVGNNRAAHNYMKVIKYVCASCLAGKSLSREGKSMVFGELLFFSTTCTCTYIGQARYTGIVQIYVGMYVLKGDT